MPLGIKLEQLKDYVLELIFGTGKGWGHRAETNLVKQEIEKFTKIDIVELYKILFNNEEYFYSLLQNNKSLESIKRIWEYTRENLETGYLHYDDAIAITYLYLKMYGANEYKNIKQVIIDEDQDYYPLQYEIFSLFKKINRKLDIQLIRNEGVSDLQGVFVIPVYMSKGLEFDAVLLCDADSQNYHDEEDKNLLYIACTRALHRLSLFCEKEVGPLVR